MNQAPLPILFQNHDFLAVEKPAGISVHNNEDPQNLILLLQRQLALKELFPVHRLDKETSGVQLLALNSAGARRWADEFQTKNVQKIYSGVLRGEIKQKQGVWNQSLSDKSEGRKNPAGLAKDRIPCETRFTLKEGNKYFSFCEFQLITGRQHQIRKHAALFNHALVGDPRYGDQNYNKKMAGIYKTDRMFLHCQRITIDGHVFESPVTAEFFVLFKG
jgi:RluA family pseudouridine synthase